MEKRFIRIFDLSRKELEYRLSDLLESGRLRVLPEESAGETLLLAQGDTQEELLPLLIETRLRLGSAIYAIETEDGGSLARTAVAAMAARGWTCATCESLTGGMISATLVEVPGASQVVRGGLVTYQTDTKTLLAGVPAEVIETHGVVSAEVAIGMAEGTRERLGVDVAVSATGLAGPGGGTAETPVGTVFVGVSTGKGTRAISLRLAGDRANIRTLAMKHAVNALRLEALK